MVGVGEWGKRVGERAMCQLLQVPWLKWNNSGLSVCLVWIGWSWHSRNWWTDRSTAAAAELVTACLPALELPRYAASRDRRRETVMIVTALRGLCYHGMETGRKSRARPMMWVSSWGQIEKMTTCVEEKKRSLARGGPWPVWSRTKKTAKTCRNFERDRSVVVAAS